MPKKSARSGAQRHRPKTQRNVELVRQNTAVKEKASSKSKEEESDEPQSAAVSTIELPESEEPQEEAAAEETQAEEEAQAEEQPAKETRSVSAPKGSAAARLAARRMGNQRGQRRDVASLITAEHYGYVRKDLLFIAILALLMLATLIILHFVPAIGG